MKAATQQRLLELNRSFYAQVAAEFDRSRSSLPLGWDALKTYLPQGDTIRVLDAGCGNGRFARFLDQQGGCWLYTGVDGDAALLAFASEHTADFPHTTVRFILADLSLDGWSAQVGEPGEHFDLIACLALLHHLPGVELRQRIMADLAALLQPDGVLILSNWQFLSSERFVQKLVPWAEIGLTEDEVEPGDGLLPWNQGIQTLRYVHQLDEAEIADLAARVGLSVSAAFYADGKEGKLNLYSILRKSL
jgi:tRNA (uracil-5-)-methyltransferase TRM9